MKNRWEERYKNKDLPWDTGRVETNLAKTIEANNIDGKKVLEVGCGTGTNALWLEEQGFTVTALDISDEAINKAQSKANESDSSIRFLVMDILRNIPDDKPFDFAFDRGVFHSFDSSKERKLFSLQIAQSLNTDALWLSLIGSCDSPPRETGPPMRSAQDIVLAVEEYFEIIELRASFFDSKRPDPAKSWYALMKKRKMQPS